MGLFNSPKEQLYGMTIVSQNIEGMHFLVLHSQLVVKSASFLQLRRITTREEVAAAKEIGLLKAKIGDRVLLPEAHRLNDIRDYLGILEKGYGQKEEAETFRQSYPKGFFDIEIKVKEPKVLPFEKEEISGISPKKQKSCNHNFSVIKYVKTLGLRKGTMIIELSCKNCGLMTQTFHDLTETEDKRFRNPKLEELLIKQCYIKKKDEKLPKFFNNEKKSFLEKWIDNRINKMLG